MRRPSLLVTFGLLSLVPVAGLALALGFSLRASIQQRAIENAKQNSVFLASVGLPGYLSKDEIAHGIAPIKGAFIATAMRNGIVGTHLDGLVIRNRAGRVVFTSSGADERAVAAFAGDLGRALRGGAVAHRMRVGSRDELEVTVPITFTFDTKPTGVLYALMPYRTIADQVRHDTRRLLLILLGGLALLYALLFPIVARASNELRRRAEENERLAMHDPLTELPNRALFGQRIERALAGGAVTGGPVALLVVDLDEFKEVNDTHGHHTGDLLLKAAAQRLQGCVREEDTVARLGGDEFGIVLSQPEARSAIELVAQRVVGVLGEPYQLDSVATRTQASVGVAIAPDHASDVELLFRRADLAMYAAKAAGGGYRIAGDAADGTRDVELLAS